MRGAYCEAHRHSGTIPQQKHHVQPLSRSGPNRKYNLVVICANAHDDTHYLLDAIEKARGYAGVPEAVKRSFGAGVRRVAMRGWAAYSVAFLAGEYRREAALWSTSGEPIAAGVPPFAEAIREVALMARTDTPLYAPGYTSWLTYAARSERWRSVLLSP